MSLTYNNFMDIEKIKKNISEAIKQSGLSQKELANKLCVDQSMISLYATGKNFPSLIVFAELCKILDISADELLDL